MPSCVRCNEFFPREADLSECPTCGGEVLSGEALVEARAAARGLSPEAYLAEREIERQNDQQARLEAEEAERQAWMAQREADLEARAAAAGLTAEEYRAESERWTGDAGGAWLPIVWSFLAPLVTGLTGVIVTVVFIVIGRSPWAAICGTVLGGVVGLILSLGLLWRTYYDLFDFDWLVRIPGWNRAGVQHLVIAFQAVVLFSPLILPPALVVVVSLLLPPVSPALVAVTIGVAIAGVGTAWLGWRWFTSQAE